MSSASASATYIASYAVAFERRARTLGAATVRSWQCRMIGSVVRSSIASTRTGPSLSDSGQPPSSQRRHRLDVRIRSGGVDRRLTAQHGSRGTFLRPPSSPSAIRQHRRVDDDHRSARSCVAATVHRFSEPDASARVEYDAIRSRTSSIVGLRARCAEFRRQILLHRHPRVSRTTLQRCVDVVRKVADQHVRHACILLALRAAPQGRFAPGLPPRHAAHRSGSPNSSRGHCGPGSAEDEPFDQLDAARSAQIAGFQPPVDVVGFDVAVGPARGHDHRLDRCAVRSGG